jgi:hypothetical protein
VTVHPKPTRTRRSSGFSAVNDALLPEIIDDN